MKRDLGYHRWLFVKWVVWTKAFLKHMCELGERHRWHVTFSGIRIIPGFYVGFMLINAEWKSRRRGR
jgi:hypothetical protein